MAVQTTEEFKNGGATSYAITIEYLKASDIKVRIDGALQTYVASSPSSGQYTVSGTTVTLGAQAASGTGNVHIYRETNVNTAAAVFVAGSSIRAADLNAIHDMARFGLSEARSTTLESDIKDGAVTSAKIKDDTIVNADVNASAAIAGTKVNPAFGSQNVSTSGTAATGNLTVTGTVGVSSNITVGGTVDGRDVAGDGAKLDGIESGATADQTAAEIRTLTEAATDSNVFTDADHTKLNNIETGATTDQTDAEIRTAVENATDSNVFTDADHTKLDGIETGATADQTNAEIRAAVEAASDSNVFTDADHTKLNNIEANADVTDATNVDAAGAVMNSDLATKGQIIVGDGSGDPTILGVGQNNYVLVADSNEATGVKWGPAPSAGGLNNIVEDTTPQLGGNLESNGHDIKFADDDKAIFGTGTGNDLEIFHESSSNTNVIEATDGDIHIRADNFMLISDDTTGRAIYLNNSGGHLELGFDGNHDAQFTGTGVTFLTNVDANAGLDVTGNITVSGTVDGIDIATDVAANTAKVTNATHTGEVTGATALTIADNVVDEANLKVSNAPTNGYFLSAQSGNTGGLTWAQVITDLLGDTSPQLGGDLDVNGHKILFATDKHLTLKTGATSHVQQGSLIIDGGNKDIFFTGGSTGSKITFGSSDALTHEVMRITPSILGSSQHGKVELKYVTANAGGNTSSSTKLATTSTGISVTGTVAATSFTGDGSNLTGLDSTTAGGAIYENSQTISTTHTIPSGSNGMSAGPVSVNNGVTLTISSGSTYTIV